MNSKGLSMNIIMIFVSSWKIILNQQTAVTVQWCWVSVYLFIYLFIYLLSYAGGSCGGGGDHNNVLYKLLIISIPAFVLFILNKYNIVWCTLCI